MQHPSAARVAVLASLAACSSAPPPLALPAVTPIVHHARTADVAAEERSPQTLHIELVALRSEPSGPAVDMAAESITRERGAPFRGASSLPPGSRWLCGDDAARWLAGRQQSDDSQQQVLGAVDAVLALGLQTRIHTGMAGMPDVVLTPRATAAGRRTSVELLSATGGGREHIHIRESLAADDGVVLFVPALVRDPAGFALLLRTSAAPSAEVVASAVASATPPVAAPDPWPAPWREALRAVGEHERRPAMLALARTLGASRCSDVLLVADERALIDTTQALSAMGPDAALGAWPFERAMWRALLARLERDELPAALQAALWRHLGAIADDAGSLRLLLTAADDEAAFAAAVQHENTDALADGDAARRVRAHDWLIAHGGAVADFDPLAPAAQRRAALRRHAATAANPEPAR